MGTIKSNSYIVMDFETGGMISKRNDPDNYKKEMEGYASSKFFPMTEFAGIALRGDDLSENIGGNRLRYETLIKPYDPELIYSKGAVELTGITKSDVETKGILIEEFMADFCTMCQEVNQISSKFRKVVLVGHNLTFDIPFLTDAAIRCNIDLSKFLDGYFDNDSVFHPRFEDTMRMSMMLWGNDLKMERYTLTYCCEKAGIELVDAHRAMNDVIPNAELFRYLVLRGRGVSDVKVGQSASQDQRSNFQF